MLKLAIACVLAASACAHVPVPPPYASFEPLTSRVPAVADQARARRLLAASRVAFGAWLAERPRAFLPLEALRSDEYTYVRAAYLDRNHVEFTAVAVEAGRPVLRVLFENRADRSGSRGPLSISSVVWIERGEELGKHDRGFAALGVKELYDRCDELIVTNDGSSPTRLYFHPNGVLMHCGLAVEDCGNCSSVSIGALSHFSLARFSNDELKRADHVACENAWGLYPAYGQDPFTPDAACLSPETRDDHADGSRSFLHWVGVCPRTRKAWPRFGEVGKAAPDLVWRIDTFPVGSECGGL